MLNLQFCWLIPTFDAGIHSMHYNNNLKASWILLVGSPLLLVKSTCCWWLLAQIHVSNGQLDKEEAKQRRNTFLRRAWTTNEFPWVPMVSHGSTWYTWTKLLKHVETCWNHVYVMQFSRRCKIEPRVYRQNDDRRGRKAEPVGFVHQKTLCCFALRSSNVVPLESLTMIGFDEI